MSSVRKYLWDFVVNGVLASPVIPVAARTRALRALGVKVGRGVVIRHRVHLTSNKLTLGDGSYINVGAVIQNGTDVRIGREVAIAPNAVISTVGHDYSNATRRQGIPENEPVTISDGAWICIGAVVLPGVTVGAGAVVAAGAVAASDCEADWMHGGVPARPFKSLKATPGPSARGAKGRRSITLRKGQDVSEGSLQPR